MKALSTIFPSIFASLLENVNGAFKSGSSLGLVHFRKLSFPARGQGLEKLHFGSQFRVRCSRSLLIQHRMNNYSSIAQLSSI